MNALQVRKAKSTDLFVEALAALEHYARVESELRRRFRGWEKTPEPGVVPTYRETSQARKVLKDAAYALFEYDGPTFERTTDYGN